MKSFQLSDDRVVVVKKTAGQLMVTIKRPPKGTALPGKTSFDVFCVNIRPGV